MRLRMLMGSLVAALLVGACGDSDSTPAGGATSPTSTPDIEATVIAEVQARLPSATGLPPTPPPLSGPERADIVAFASSAGQITSELDDFHVAFDAWRNGLISCDPSSVRVTLGQFAGTMDGVAAKSSLLPRSPSVRGLADTLIDAAEREAEAVRQLRDGWEPGAQIGRTSGSQGVPTATPAPRFGFPAPEPRFGFAEQEAPSSSRTSQGSVTVFENVDIERSTALALRRDVQDTLSDLQERMTTDSKSKETGFAVAVQRINSDWDDFRRSYDTFRRQLADLDPALSAARVNDLIDEFRKIVIAIRDLPVDPVTRSVSLTLAEAAEAEELVLRRLRGTSQGVVQEAAAPTPDPFFGPGPVAAPQPTSGYGASFGAFDAQISRSDALRRQVLREVAGLVQETTEDAQRDVEQFSEQNTLLLTQWDGFHKNYDEWRRTEGGCDRSKAIETLGQFTSDFAALTRNARELPGGTLLASLRELFVEAAELEEERLRDLRNT